MYVGGKVNYVDKIDADLFIVDELHLFVQDLGYDPEQLMFYHYKLPNKGLDYGLKPISCDADVISLIKLVENCKVIEVFIEYWLTNVDHHYLSLFKSTVEIEELDDDVLNAPLDNIEDEEGRGNDREEFIVDEEHVIDEVEVNMEGFTFSVKEQGADQNVTPNVDLTDEALEVLDFDSFDSDVGDDTASLKCLQD
ncbi:hypothetical protein Tco_1163363 [Tanacetum coccineum]